MSKIPEPFQYFVYNFKIPRLFQDWKMLPHFSSFSSRCRNLDKFWLIGTEKAVIYGYILGCHLLCKALFKAISFWKYLAFTFLCSLLGRATCHLQPLFTVNFSGPSKQVLLYSPHGSAEFLVRHFRVLFAHSPHPRHLLRAHHAEHTLPSVLPPDQGRVVLWVEQQFTDELPQVQHTVSCRS